MKQVNSSMVMKLISRVERMGSMGWLQHKLWWRHTDQGKGVQEEKVVGCCYNNLFIIVTTITTIIVCHHHQIFHDCHQLEPTFNIHTMIIIICAGARVWERKDGFATLFHVQVFTHC